ncbi:SOS response-associated peptidase [Gryllotalpicola ginsengisoli]|uniref:SOS response-associated peptidase n=1 Tax=Gryllotalpicola ginsengisoli TaxID=444608 RepID=UPI0003B662B5|nr:SOS response-associated peptidase [Gryllotalpicola ginsengisoli]
MCGRFALDDKVNQLITDFVMSGGRLDDYVPASWVPSWNISPTDRIGVILETKKGDAPPQRRFETAYWSLIPSWSKEKKLKFPTFNARAETAAEKAMFKPSVVSKRAIIPANGYYEWQTVGKTKTPYFIHPPGDELLGMAGLYSWWADPAYDKDDPDRWLLTATILTADTVQTLADIHDRNPVMLPRELWEHWIDPTVVGDQRLLDEAVAASLEVASGLEFTRVGPVKGDGPELIRPLEQEG